PSAHAPEIPVHQISAHFTLHDSIAPVANVLEDQQSQHDFGGRTQTTTRSALGMPFGQSFKNDRQQLLVFEQLISVCHPVFEQVCYLGVDEPVAEAELWPARLNHAYLLRGILTSCSSCLRRDHCVRCSI